MVDHPLDLVHLEPHEFPGHPKRFEEELVQAWLLWLSWFVVVVVVVAVVAVVAVVVAVVVVVLQDR